MALLGESGKGLTGFQQIGEADIEVTNEMILE
jgi:hypothetical protein